MHPSRPTSPTRAELALYAWASGRGILVSQWFTNGSLGSSWLPGFAALDSFSLAGQIGTYVVYSLLLLLAGVVLRQRTVNVRHPRSVLVISTALLALSDLVVGLVGLGILEARWYLPGMVGIGISMTVPMLGWSVFCCMVGERRTCITVALSFTTGAALYAGIAALGSISPLAATALQVGLIPWSGVCLAKSWEHARRGFSPVDVGEDEPPLTLRPILPYLITILAFGLVFGSVIGINNSQPTGSPAMSWVMGTVMMGLPALLGAHFARSFNLGVLARMLLPAFLLCTYLFPFAVNRIPSLVSILGCAAYTFSIIFYQTAFAAIAETRKVPVLPLVTLAICVDSFGIVAGEYACSAFGFAAGISSRAVYTITFSVVILAILAGFLFLGDRSTASLWGLKPEPTERDRAERRSLAVASKHGLTLRETEVLCLLATGLDPADVARELNISAATARTHARNIYAKLELHSQPDLIRYVLFDSAGQEGQAR